MPAAAEAEASVTYDSAMLRLKKHVFKQRVRWVRQQHCRSRGAGSRLLQCVPRDAVRLSTYARAHAHGMHRSTHMLTTQ